MLHGILGGLDDLIRHGQEGRLVTQHHEHEIRERAVEHLATVILGMGS